MGERDRRSTNTSSMATAVTAYFANERARYPCERFRFVPKSVTLDTVFPDSGR
jgi:hypothetical protein